MVLNMQRGLLADKCIIFTSSALAKLKEEIALYTDLLLFDCRYEMLLRFYILKYQHSHSLHPCFVFTTYTIQDWRMMQPIWAHQYSYYFQEEPRLSKETPKMQGRTCKLYRERLLQGLESRKGMPCYEATANEGCSSAQPCKLLSEITLKIVIILYQFDNL